MVHRSAVLRRSIVFGATLCTVHISSILQMALICYALARRGVKRLCFWAPSRRRRYVAGSRSWCYAAGEKGSVSVEASAERDPAPVWGKNSVCFAKWFYLFWASIFICSCNRGHRVPCKDRMGGYWRGYVDLLCMQPRVCTRLPIMGGAFRKKLVGQNAMSTDGYPSKTW